MWHIAWSIGVLFGRARLCSIDTAEQCRRRADLAGCNPSATNRSTKELWLWSEPATSCPSVCRDRWRPDCWCYNDKCASGMSPAIINNDYDNNNCTIHQRISCTEVVINCVARFIENCTFTFVNCFNVKCQRGFTKQWRMSREFCKHRTTHSFDSTRGEYRSGGDA